MSKVSIESYIKKANGFTYILLIYYNESCDIVVGRLGHVKINKGYYIYIGSAKKNINSRLNRHLSAKKNKFWHIDYVLSNPFPFLIVNIWTSQELIECQISKELFKSNYCYLVKKGFGSSDCHCTTHFFRISKNKLGALEDKLMEKRFAPLIDR
ncbi:MAG: GIY-YIG nuclease family protein [Atribacterota bacterium]|nr:GIY-YIG nuclease family protein [Atribacterota bacterium]